MSEDTLFSCTFMKLNGVHDLLICIVKKTSNSTHCYQNLL